MSGGAGTDTIVGSGSLMPIDMLIRKQERTCMYESPDLVENFHRNTLKDMRPLPALFESDEVRGGRDENGELMGNPQSQQLLDRHYVGRRSEAEPYLPDGTFLDWQFLEQDPRGVALGPDFRKHAQQQFARGSLYNYRSDADNSIPESGVNPWQMQMDIRNAQNVTKDYMKIFETSFDGWHNGGMAPGYAKSVKERTSDDGVIKDPVHAPNRNRIDKTNNMSNDTSIGWRRTTDNRFEVAKYGKNNVGKSFTDENWYKNRGNVHIDHDTIVSWQDTNVSKATALKMMDLAKQKQTIQFTGMNGINWQTSKQARPSQKKLTPADMAGMQARQTKETRATDSHTMIDGEQNTQAVSLKKETSRMGKSHINTAIFEKMGLVNKRITKKQKSDLRDSIKQSAKLNYLYKDTMHKSNKVPTVDHNVLRKSKHMQVVGKSKEVVNYKSAAKSTKGHVSQKIGEIEIKDITKIGEQRALRVKKNIGSDKSKTEFAQKNILDVDRSKRVGPMGSKYMTNYIDRDTSHSNVNDV